MVRKNVHTFLMAKFTSCILYAYPSILSLLGGNLKRYIVTQLIALYIVRQLPVIRLLTFDQNQAGVTRFLTSEFQRISYIRVLSFIRKAASEAVSSSCNVFINLQVSKFTLVMWVLSFFCHLAHVIKNEVLRTGYLLDSTTNARLRHSSTLFKYIKHQALYSVSRVKKNAVFIQITSSLFTLAVQTSKDGQNCICGTSLTIEVGGVTRFDRQFEDSVEL